MIQLGAVVCAASFLGLIYREMKIAEPVVNFRILRNLALKEVLRCLTVKRVLNYNLTTMELFSHDLQIRF